MSFDWSIRVTDLAIVFATLTGPFLAVYVTEKQRHRADARNRKIHIFRTLMATRSANLALIHIEALNLVEIEFHSSKRHEQVVVDCYRLYLAHLCDQVYPRESWGFRRHDLLIDLLYAMSQSLGYSFEKSQIKVNAYYPYHFVDEDSDKYEIRKLFLEVLRGNRAFPMCANVYFPNIKTNTNNQGP